MATSINFTRKKIVFFFYYVINNFEKQNYVIGKLYMN